MAVTTYYKDIDLSFEKTSTGDIPIATNMNSIKVSIYNSLMINDNENFFAEDFGNNLRSILFEPHDDITELTLANMIDSVVENDDRISHIEDLEIEFVPESKTYIIRLKVKIINLIDIQDIELILKKTR